MKERLWLRNVVDLVLADVDNDVDIAVDELDVVDEVVKVDVVVVGDVVVTDNVDVVDGPVELVDVVDSVVESKTRLKYVSHFKNESSP